MEGSLLTATVAALACLVLASAMPALVRRLPEPAEAAPDKISYRDLSTSTGLRAGAMITAALVGGVAGWRLDWSWDLLLWTLLIPVGVALAVIDWRTRLLPTRLVAPSYAVVCAVILVGALVEWQATDLLRAAAGWALAGGLYLLLWFVHPRGMGYGDVRLSGVLGLVLGHLSWGTLLVGVYAGFLLGGVLGLLLARLKIVESKAVPFGPFMLAGALVGLLGGDWLSLVAGAV
ncbi:prepilin peptidase [Nocardioides limicola]|uniref:prepilin peptidase n=1 Tax=Nocardioides limicola TaxID=2803368 RepID=UPI00193B672F|nr:A24 family peptidase [Nocardioides sp. DJM-14]